MKRWVGVGEMQEWPRCTHPAAHPVAQPPAPPPIPAPPTHTYGRMKKTSEEREAKRKFTMEGGSNINVTATAARPQLDSSSVAGNGQAHQ